MMSTVLPKTILLFVLSTLHIQGTMAFVPTNNIKLTNKVQQRLVAQKPYATPNDEELEQSSDSNPIETFFETTALSGAEKIKKISIEERTRRAMVAEAIEDRVSNLYDDFEVTYQKIQDTDDVKDKEELKNIAKQIKVLQEEYRTVVNGDDHMLV